MFSDRHQRFGPYTCDVSPSRYPNNDVKDENVVHEELNDYLNSILNYLGKLYLYIYKFLSNS